MRFSSFIYIQDIVLPFGSARTMEGSRWSEEYEAYLGYRDHCRLQAAAAEPAMSDRLEGATDASALAYGTPDSFANECSQGLPVRQWRQQMVTVAPSSEREENKKNDLWDQELPHGMPKDTHLLTPHNQELLRLARSGKLYRKRPLPEEDDADADGDRRESTAGEGYSFKVKKWVRLERSAEDSGVNYLAPRQKGTITRPSRQLGTQLTGPMVTKATVKRVDAAGNPYTQEVIIPDGQAVDGEIISTSVVPAPEAAGEAASSSATPMRRKPPIPQKKKGRGRGRGGRGRGKIPLFTPTRPIPQQDGSTEVKSEAVGPDVSMRFMRSGRVCLTISQRVKIESEDAARNGGDVEMNESSALDDEDGDEGSGDDDAGDGDESATPAAEGEDQEMKDAPSYPPSDSAVDAPPAAMFTEAPQPVANLIPPPLVTDPTQLEGSPLKNVTLRSPTDPSPHLSPIAATVTASAEAGLSEVPGESTLGLQPSVAEPQQAILLSQAFLKVRPVDNQPAEPAVPVPAETAPTETARVEAIVPTIADSDAPALEPIPDQPIVPSAAVESASIAEPSPIVESPPIVEPIVEPPPVVEPPAQVEPLPAVKPPLQVEELPTMPPKEDVPLPSSEVPMPGQASGPSEQQVPAATEPAPPSPIIAPVTAPLPSPPPVVQVPAEEAIGDMGAGEVKAEGAAAESMAAEGVSAEDVGAEDTGAEAAGTKEIADEATIGADETRADEAGADNVVTGDVVTEDVGMEDGSFDILGSLSTSLNQQAENDVPPPSIPTGPTDTATEEPAQPARSDETVLPVLPAQPAQPDETNVSGQTGETGEFGHTENMGQEGQTSQTVQNGEPGEAPTQEKPEAEV